MSKIGLSILVAGVAGIIAGIIFFLLRKTPSPETCKNSGPLKREFLLNAVLVSSLLSCLVFFCSTKLSAQDKQENATEQKTAAANDIKKIIESKEWQELKVFWNLITARAYTLEGSGDKNNLNMWIPAWKKILLDTIADYKIKKLDCLVAEGAMTKQTQKALSHIFNGMVSHVCASKSGSTCYLMIPEGGERRNRLDILLARSIFLQNQFRKGQLKPDVIRDISEEILMSLDPMSLIDDELKTPQSEKDEIIIEDSPKEKSPSIQSETNELIIIEDKPKTVSNKIIDFIIDMNEYTSSQDAEKSLYEELHGKNAVSILLGHLEHANRNMKINIADAFGSIGGDEVIPVLQDLYKDESISTFKRYDSHTKIIGGADDDDLPLFVFYPVRDAAAKSLKKYKVDVEEKSERSADSPEGREMILKALENGDDESLMSAISAACHSKDKSMIPSLVEIMKNGKEYMDGYPKYWSRDMAAAVLRKLGKNVNKISDGVYEIENP